MAQACLFSPVDKSNKPYKALPVYKKEFGSSIGPKAFLKALSPSFQKQYEGKLEIDDQGVATLETTIKTHAMKELVGFEAIKKSLDKKYNFTEVPNTADNFRLLVNEAKAFNDQNEEYIAYPEKTDHGIKNVIHKKDAASVKAFNDRYGSLILNDKLVSIFKPLGVTVADLYETERGYSGVVDFNNAKSVAGEFINLIRVANNMEGQLDMSEEFAHLIVRILREQPLMQRLIKNLADNIDKMQQILGDSYDQYVETFTDDNGVTHLEMVAEECVGRLLQESMRNNAVAQEEGSYIEKLWNRLLNFIKKVFKDYDYNAINEAVLNADQTIDTLAKGLLKGAIEFNKEDVESTLPKIEREMQDIKAKAIADGTFMKAPNGKPTNLTERQWLQVRTKAFKNWFGDWINDPANASKVVDENGEPLVVYHYSDNETLTKFSTDFDNYFSQSGGTKKAIFFTEDNPNEEERGSNFLTKRKNKIAAFLNIKDLKTYKGTKEDLHNQGTSYREVVNKSAEENDVDGGVHMEDFDDNKKEHQSIWIIHNPNQVKSATDNIGTFSKYNDDIMYHLEKNVDYLQKVVEDTIATETKKKIIVKNDKSQEIAQRKIDNLKAILKGSPEGKLKGIINYAHAAVNDLGSAREALGKNDIGTNFSKLRGIRTTIQAYADFITQLGELINSQDEELAKLIANTSIEDKHHTIVSLKYAYDELSSLNTLVRERFKNVALDSIENFFKPFFNVKGKFVDGSGKERTLRELIEEANGDIGFADRYFMTMSSSGDLLLQLFNEVARKAKADARYNTIDDIADITRLMLYAEDKGITTYDWMYEKDSEGHKTGNYISAVNLGQYKKDREEFFRQLDEEYGINPTGAKAREKKAKKQAWVEKHGRFKPKAGFYHNNDFDRLSSAQKDVLDKFMQIKQKFDRRLPANKTSASKAIQMRRTSQQRLLNSLSDPSQAYQNIVESIAKEFTKSSDDDAIYGEKTGLRSFDGSEFKVLPAIYTTSLSNPEELTSDVFSALAAYSYSTNVYKEMDKVVDPLEVAKGWIADPKNRKINEMSNNMKLVEKVQGIINPITKNGGSYIIAKLEDFMDSQVYQRYYADSDKTINFMGRELKAGKIVNKWLSISSAVQLGFNALAHLGNAATGAAMQNIEAFCGHYFNAKELFAADGQYAKELMSMLPELESKNPTNKLALFDQLFDIKQEFAGNIKNRMNTMFEKVFGKSIAFLGQTCGDHWLYNRTAIAMCLRKKVRLSDGTVTSLWDALKVENVYKDNDRIKKLVIDAVDAETGEVIDREYIRKYSEKINEINHRLFGVYNTDDMVAAQRVALGRCILQYRQWIVPMFARRFQNRKYIAALGEYEEGYYRTFFNMLAGLRGGMTGVMEVWNEFDEPQKRNVYRALIEISQFMLIWAIANFIDFGKGDPDRCWGMKLAEYMAQRELHELGNLTPSFTMGNEILKTVKSPASILNTTQSALNLVSSLLDPRDWNDEIESGKYEGMSTLHKNILKAPFPILAPFNQLDRFTENIEEVTRYYARSY